MKYIANPVIVEASKITHAQEDVLNNGVALKLADGSNFLADSGMIARYTPKAGDYLVTQADGYQYLNPREVFERKYSPLKPEAADGEQQKEEIQSE